VAEIVWAGKYREGQRVRSPRAVHPIETDEVFGAPGQGSANRLVLGDQAHALAALLDEFAGQVGLVYIDPPFDTGGAFDFLASVPGAPDDAPRIPVHAYDDARGLDRWLAWFSDAVSLLGELLADGGSLYVHLDAHVSHYAKVVLDEVFGKGAFQREIVWRIGWVSGFKSRARTWVRNHDTILFYAKGGRVRTFHKAYVPYPPGYVRRDGKPPRGAGYPMEDVWNASENDRLDSIQIMSFSGEKVGYPTQKNEALLSRIVRASSNPGDLVLDCFSGSGTTAVAAERLSRRWIVCDSAPVAIHATRKRLLAMPEVRPFVVQRVGESTWPLGGVLVVAGWIDGRGARLELRSFEMMTQASIPLRTRDAVSHWSQWLEGWCVDWDHQGSALHAESTVWRRSRSGLLPLAATHEYDAPGFRRVLVKAFDVLGGVSTVEVQLDGR
jgi:DNA modification methylase